ncbi:hypothetical protein [Cesiribacter andamanensis]|uniref:DUF3575 domain-containing protein n=1 Tax=Cesiribacter andamanensis AMV16 TaxID=1279009 RepID=M7P186_9BACT|nr:hypothetical protein [Cesiribacter andamanensis]EMR04359.1 hypothetical protein ADICEAN_00522 [Cesiribacter andamanensis AMV16]
MKKTGVLIGFIMMLMALQAQAQDYGTAVGLRLSPFWGASIKHFISGTDALEGIVHSRWHAFKVTGLWERHTPAFREPGLKFYYGAGAHLGATSGRYYNDSYYNRGRLILGIDGILGLEYTVQDASVPLSASLDWKPAFDLAPFAGFWGSELALSVRYTF